MTDLSRQTKRGGDVLVRKAGCQGKSDSIYCLVSGRGPVLNGGKVTGLREVGAGGKQSSEAVIWGHDGIAWNSARNMTHVVSDPRASIGIPRDPILGRRDSGTIYFVSKFGGVAVKENHQTYTLSARIREVDRRQPASWFLIKEALKPEASCTLPEVMQIVKVGTNQESVLPTMLELSEALVGSTCSESMPISPTLIATERTQPETNRKGSSKDIPNVISRMIRTPYILAKGRGAQAGHVREDRVKTVPVFDLWDTNAKKHISMRLEREENSTILVIQGPMLSRGCRNNDGHQEFVASI
ncbi:hypothetical protein P692DRAFT_20860644 [Suillus brevipes Sb2]|nr:hypothetical protein P692DRAFT_20860644 [Suillus brevipes Sb2]